MSATGYVALLTTQVLCEEFSKCYNDVNICLWTDGSMLNQNQAKSACQQRNSVLLRVTNSNIQSKLAGFRSEASSLLGNSGFWIDVTAVGIDSVHWIDGSQLAGWFMPVLYNAIQWHRFPRSSDLLS